MNPPPASPPPGDLHGAALGEARVRALRAHALGEPVAAVDAATRPWVLAFPAQGLRGLDLGSIPADYREVLGWVGMPLSRASTVRWGLQVRPYGDASSRTTSSAPVWDEAVLWLPPPAQLRACSAIALRPLRAFAAWHWQCRLQAAAGIHCWYWQDRCLLVSTREQVLCGFLHGPARQRATIRLAPGEDVSVRW